MGLAPNMFFEGEGSRVEVLLLLLFGRTLTGKEGTCLLGYSSAKVYLQDQGEVTVVVIINTSQELIKGMFAIWDQPLFPS